VIAIFYCLSLPVVGRALLGPLETTPPLSVATLSGGISDAIVILGGGQSSSAPEFGGATVATGTLERLRYGVFLHRRTGLPIAITGGDPRQIGTTEAGLGAAILQQEWGIKVSWQEVKSRDTAENARFTYALLAPQGIRRILLVTHAAHMPRAQAAFAQEGFIVLPAPTQFHSRATEEPPILNYLPSLGGLSDATAALYEILGRILGIAREGIGT
jgi:uncharacterized SAM-binding protein YcdF (DUF218 family)